MLRLIDTKFLHKHSEWGDIKMRESKVKEWITNKPEFCFCMTDIRQLRNEMRTLIDNLVKLYRKNKKIETKKKQNKLLLGKQKQQAEQ